MSNTKNKAPAKQSSGVNVIIAVIAVVLAIVMAVGVFLVVSLISQNGSAYKETKETTQYVRLTVKDHGDIVLELRPDVAPITVANFQKLVGEGFYDGLTFHRIIENFMIQGGAPKTGESSPQTIKGEFSANGVPNSLTHKRGVLSMARTNDMNGASSQFFICNSDDVSHLNGKYAAFGTVVEGMDVVDSITAVKKVTGTDGRPVDPVVIEKACFVKLK